jgi:hypothetical protein
VIQDKLAVEASPDFDRGLGRKIGVSADLTNSLSDPIFRALNLNPFR